MFSTDLGHQTCGCRSRTVEGRPETRKAGRHDTRGISVVRRIPHEDRKRKVAVVSYLISSGLEIRMKKFAPARSNQKPGLHNGKKNGEGGKSSLSFRAADFDTSSRVQGAGLCCSMEAYVWAEKRCVVCRLPPHPHADPEVRLAPDVPTEELNGSRDQSWVGNCGLRRAKSTA